MLSDGSPANALSGTPNTPANIAPGAFQNYVFGFAPTGPIAETSLAMRFSCFNANVCKECTMLIDGNAEYACIAKLKVGLIQLDPLPNLPIIRDLVTEELSPYCPEGEVRADVRGPSLILKPKSAQSTAIVLHELTTNAVKYGALSVRSGHLQVEWSHRADGMLVILWTESGGPPVREPERRGLGTALLERALKGAIGGRTELEWPVSGVVCRLWLG